MRAKNKVALAVELSLVKIKHKNTTLTTLGHSKEQFFPINFVCLDKGFTSHFFSHVGTDLSHKVVVAIQLH